MSGYSVAQIQALKEKYKDQVPAISIPTIDEFKKIGIVQEPKLNLEQLAALFNKDGDYKGVTLRTAYNNYVPESGLKQQFQRWYNYMNTINNAFDGNKYNMILKEQFLRNFGNIEQVKAMNNARQAKKNKTMGDRMMDFRIVGTINVLIDRQNGYYYKKKGQQYHLIGKKDLVGIDKDDITYNELKELILENNQKQAMSRSKKTNQQILQSSAKKRAKNIYLQQGQLNKFRKRLYKGDDKMDINAFRAQGQNQYQKEEIKRLTDSTKALEAGLQEKSIDKIEAKRTARFTRLQNRRLLGETLAKNQK